jgi:MSHA biogenesis protein MshJ
MKLQWPAMMQTGMKRFDALSLRERLLVSIVVFACLWAAWDSLLMQPLNHRQAALLATLDNSGDAAVVAADPATQTAPAESSDNNVPQPEAISVLLLQRESLQAHLLTLDQQLKAVSAELVAPERTSEVLYEVLQKQHNLALISLHNQPVRSLIAAQPPTSNANNASEITDHNISAQLGPGPYVHPVELVIEGRYLDILDYLRALEALPWRFNWQALQLDSSRYPLNRARIELSTLSLDPAWIGT